MDICIINEKVFKKSNMSPLCAGKELWAVVSSALALARQNPTPFVSAVRIVEREEALDRALPEERRGAKGHSRPLPSGRPRCWRASFFQVRIQHNTSPLIITSFTFLLCLTFPPSGAGGGGSGQVPQCLLPAHAGPRARRPPVGSPTRHHG